MVTEYRVVRENGRWYVVECPAPHVQWAIAGPFATKAEANMAIPMKARTIKQDELQSALNARLVVETLERQLRDAKDERDRIELVLVSRIKKGDPTERGELSAIVQASEGRRTPKWKDEYARVAGPEAVEKVIESTPRTPGEDKLIISAAGRAVKTA